MEESEKRAAEAIRLKDELLKARAAEKLAKEKLLEFLSRTSTYSGSNTASPIPVSRGISLSIYLVPLKP